MKNSDSNNNNDRGAAARGDAADQAGPHRRLGPDAGPCAPLALLSSSHNRHYLAHNRHYIRDITAITKRTRWPARPRMAVVMRCTAILKHKQEGHFNLNDSDGWLGPPDAVRAPLLPAAAPAGRFAPPSEPLRG